MKLFNNRQDKILMLEVSDFDNPVRIALQLRGIHVSMVFVPECMGELFKETELWRLIQPNFSISGYTFADIMTYKTMENLRNEC